MNRPVSPALPPAARGTDIPANTRGALLVLFAMAAFSIEDALVKALSQRWPVGQILLCLGLGGAAIFAAIAGREGRGWILRALAAPTVLWRTMLEGLSGACFTTALALIPISTVAAVFQATPLAVTAGAALFLGERVGWRRWGAVVVGFVGVFMIIRPGMTGFSPVSALVLVAVVCIAARDLVTQRVPRDIPSVAVSFHGFAAVAVVGAIMLAFGAPPVRPEPAETAFLAGTILCGTAGYYAIVASMRGAEVSSLMPYRYARLVFSLALGVAFFAERPDALTLSGALLILAAAFYTYRRERKLALTNRAAH